MATAMTGVEFLVVHCSATAASPTITAETIEGWHRKQGWSDIGYHFVVLTDGSWQVGRPLTTPGAHVQGYNLRSLGICMVGGADANGRAVNNFHASQFHGLETLLRNLRVSYPDAPICGHRDLSTDLDGDGIVEPHEWVKQCPSFDVRAWCQQIGLDPLPMPAPRSK